MCGDRTALYFALGLSCAWSKNTYIAYLHGGTSRDAQKLAEVKGVNAVP